MSLKETLQIPHKEFHKTVFVDFALGKELVERHLADPKVRAELKELFGDEDAARKCDEAWAYLFSPLCDDNPHGSFVFRSDAERMAIAKKRKGE